MLWPNQTHYPYNSKGTKEKYVQNNIEQNDYLNALRNIDESFGMLMEGLQKSGQLQNTL